MRLLMDCGNTRLKWRLVEGEQMQEGSLAWEGFAAQDLLEDWQEAVCALGAPQTHPRGIWCSVAPPDRTASARAAIEAFCATSGARAFRVTAGLTLSIAQHRVTLRNAYEQPESMGQDRWAAALGLLWCLFGADPRAPGAQHLLAPGRFSVAVVSAGTATVVDQLIGERTAQGWSCHLQLGHIQPGLRSSAKALSLAAPALGPYLLQALESAQQPLASSGLQPSSAQAVAQGLRASQLGGLLWTHQAAPIEAVWLHGGDAAWWADALGASPWRGAWPVYEAALIFAGLEAAWSIESAQGAPL
jgi:pantothenate kinase type III